MDVEALRTLVAVAETGQFQAAADELGISQQAVSKRIAALETPMPSAGSSGSSSGASQGSGGNSQSSTGSSSSSGTSSSPTAQIVVISTNSYLVNASVDDTEVGQIKTGDQAVITPNGSTAEVYGTVSSVAPVNQP